VGNSRKMPRLELILTPSHLILLKVAQSEAALWVSRRDGSVSLRPSWELAGEESPSCLGSVWGLVGLVRHSVLELSYLLLIREAEHVADIPDTEGLVLKHAIYVVKSVVLVPITMEPFELDQSLKPCPKHHIGVIDPQSGSDPQTENLPKFPFKSLGGKIKLAGETLKSTAGSAAGIAVQVVKGGQGEPARHQRRLIDELIKLFNDSQAFYFSFTGDLTNSLQRQYEDRDINNGIPRHKRVDDRFFFNKPLLASLLELEHPDLDDWILPMIQGFVEVKECGIDMSSLDGGYEGHRLPSFYTLCLVSRRAWQRAGTRYKRRGVDATGKVANYVETEQVVLYHSYALSFVQIRGSIPVFWSQPGIKYRPPPRIDRDTKENQLAFSCHMREQLEVYGPVTCVNLIERTGREKALFDAFLENILAFNHQDVAFVSFDFHEYCRGMRFENVSILLENIQEMVAVQGYFWLDSHGRVCSQSGVFRVNCVDCLDRTNVVQTAVGRAVLEIQLAKLGVLQPEVGLPLQAKKNFQSLWANNGDRISMQYAGTNALKGDYTRTGERNLSGLVKDGVNSASRYYLNHMKDTYRQAAIDMLIGIPISEEIFKAESEKDIEEVDGESSAVHVRTVIDDCLKQLIQENERIMGAWGLIDADPDTGDFSQEGMDIVFILTEDSYVSARYDDDLDKIVSYQKVPFEDIIKIEVGVPEQGFNLGFLNPKSEVTCFRIQYKIGDETGFQHTFRSTCLRFFNNMATELSSEEEKAECLKTIADTLAVTMEAANTTPDLWFGKLEKKIGRQGPIKKLMNPVELLNLQMNKSNSNKSSSKLKNVSSAALNNVTSRFQKLNPIARLRKGGGKKEFTDIRKEVEPDSGLEVFEDSLNSQPLHLASSGLLINTQEGDVDICMQTNSISYTASQVPRPKIKVDHVEPSGSPIASRRKKISKSSEDLSSTGSSQLNSAFGNVIAPFGKLAKGLNSIGSQLDNRLENKVDEFTSLYDQAKEEGELNLCYGSVCPEPLESSHCQSLILNI